MRSHHSQEAAGRCVEVALCGGGGVAEGVRGDLVPHVSVCGSVALLRIISVA